MDFDAEFDEEKDGVGTDDDGDLGPLPLDDDDETEEAIPGLDDEE